jgi:hypothetical protein
MGRFDVQAIVSTTILDEIYNDLEWDQFLPRIAEGVGNLIYEKPVHEGFKFDNVPGCDACR